MIGIGAASSDNARSDARQRYIALRGTFRTDLPARDKETKAMTLPS